MYLILSFVLNTWLMHAIFSRGEGPRLVFAAHSRLFDMKMIKMRFLRKRKVRDTLKSSKACLDAADFADIVVLAVRAGVSPRQALLQAAEGAEEESAPAGVKRLVAVGLSVSEAIRHVRGRQNEPIGDVLDTVAFSAEMGTSVGVALDRQSLSLRSEAMARLEEQAGRAAVKMLFPLVLFLLPEILILLVGGASRELFSALGQP